MITLFLAAILAQPQATIVATGNVYYSDGVTPIAGKGGEDWKLQPRDAKGNEQPFTVTYVGSNYTIRVNTALLPADKQMQITFWYGDQADRCIEGLATTGRVQIVDILSSAERP